MSVKDIDYNKDYYACLGVTKDATNDEIKKAFREASVKWHPDKHTNDSEEDKKNAEDKFKEINEAYSILKDKELREAYDKGEPDPFEGFNPFGGFGEMREPEPEAKPLYVRIRVTYDDLINGIHEKDISFEKDVRCPECGGAGGTGIKECPHCHGTGMKITEKRQGFSIFRTQTICPYCNGEGKTIEKKCKKCHGEGLIKQKTSFPLTIPSEHLLIDGAKLFVGNFGNECKDNRYPDGPLIILIKHELPNDIEIIPDSWNGTIHLAKKVDIPISDLLLGTDIQVETPQKKTLKVHIPECTLPGTSMRLSKQGFIYKGNKGDMHVVVGILMPKKLTKEQKEEIKKLKELQL